MKQMIHGHPVEVPQGPRTYKKMVNGEVVDMTLDEIDVQLALEAEWEGQRERASLMEQIRELELLETPRRISEAILNQDNGWLADNRSQIASLRAQLQTEQG